MAGKKRRESNPRGKRLLGDPTAPAPLLVVDQKPFLKKALASCRRLRTELNKKQSRLELFETEDRPAFEQWRAATFGATLSRIRETREEAQAWEFLLSHLEICARFEPEKVPALYRDLLDRKKAGSLFEFVSPFAEKLEEEAREKRERFEGFWDAFFGDGNEDFGEDDEDFGPRPGGFPGEDFGGTNGEGREAPPGVPGPNGVSAEEQRLKASYRKLAKRLHPDQSEIAEPLRARRWEEMQRAYHSRDLEALLRVEAVCDMDDQGLSLGLGIARLRELAHYHQSHLRPLREALREAKRHPAFGFAEKGPCRKVEEEIRRDLTEELEEVREDAEEFRSFADSLVGEVEDFFREEAAQEAPAQRQPSKQAAKEAATRKPPPPEEDAEPTRAEQLRFF